MDAVSFTRNGRCSSTAPSGLIGAVPSGRRRSWGKVARFGGETKVHEVDGIETADD
jgi:hypothetical protein